MSATRDGKGTSRVPPENAAAVARHVEAEIARSHKGKAERKIAEALGITQPTLNKVRNMTGSLGGNTLIALRNALRLPIDDLLGLPPLGPVKELSPAELEKIRELLRSERVEPTKPPLPPPAKARERRS